jgi:hypothetical protein
VGQGEGRMGVPLDHLVAMVNLCVESLTFHGQPRMPRAVHEIMGIFHKTGMQKMLEMSPVNVICGGNRRYCQDENRAIAIMSVLGTLDWYQRYRCQRRRQATFKILQQFDRDFVAKFVHGKYPLEFLEEVKEKFGGLLFSAVENSQLDSRHYSYSFPWRRITNARLQATMLPFSVDIRRIRDMPIPTFVEGMLSHPAVSGWTINADGSVTIRETGILALRPWPRVKTSETLLRS